MKKQTFSLYGLLLWCFILALIFLCLKQRREIEDLHSQIFGLVGQKSLESSDATSRLNFITSDGFTHESVRSEAASLSISALFDQNVSVRHAANEQLVEISGLDMKFRPDDTLESRIAASAKWLNWYSSEFEKQSR